MNLLSIQSHVVYGHVGNAAAVFPLQRMGIEVWPVHTVQFSNHTGYGDWKGQVFDAALIRDVVAGIAQRGVLAECDGVLSGYRAGARVLVGVGSGRRAGRMARAVPHVGTRYGVRDRTCERPGPGGRHRTRPAASAELRG